MTAARPVIGAIFIAILLVGIVYAAVSPILQPGGFPRIGLPWTGYTRGNIVDRYSLFKGTNVSDGVKFVTLNISAKFGTISLLFSNRLNLACDVSFQRAANTSALQATFVGTSNDQGLLSLHGEAGELNVTLGKDYQYSGNMDVRIGGVIMDLGQYANVSNIAVSIRYLGGIIMKIGSGASVERLDLSMDVGGLELLTDADSLKSSVVVNANISIGGYAMSVNVNTSNVGVSLNSTVDIGRLAITHSDFHGKNSTESCTIETKGYESARNELDINVKVGLGGGILQKSLPYSYSPFNP